MISATICSLKGIHCITCTRQIELASCLGGNKHKDSVLQKIKMSERHFRCLCFLFENKDVVISKSKLISHVWHGSVVGPSSLGVLIYELRESLKFLDVSIITVRGKGYVLMDDEHLLGVSTHT